MHNAQRKVPEASFVEMKKAGKAKVTIVKIASGSSLKTYACPTPDCAPEVDEDYFDSLAEMGANRAKNGHPPATANSLASLQASRRQNVSDFAV